MDIGALNPDKNVIIPACVFFATAKISFK